MSARTSYPAGVKARALAALLTGGRVCVVAREHGIPENTIKTWRRRLRTGELKPEKRGAMGGLLSEHLEASLRSLTTQSRHLAKEEALLEMDARESALFYGTLFDQTMRMLELVGPMLRARGEGGR